MWELCANEKELLASDQRTHSVWSLHVWSGRPWSDPRSHGDGAKQCPVKSELVPEESLWESSSEPQELPLHQIVMSRETPAGLNYRSSLSKTALGGLGLSPDTVANWFCSSLLCLLHARTKSDLNNKKKEKKKEAFCLKLLTFQHSRVFISQLVI